MSLSWDGTCSMPEVQLRTFGYVYYANSFQINHRQQDGWSPQVTMTAHSVAQLNEEPFGLSISPRAQWDIWCNHSQQLAATEGAIMLTHRLIPCLDVRESRG